MPVQGNPADPVDEFTRAVEDAVQALESFSARASMASAGGLGATAGVGAGSAGGGGGRPGRASSSSLGMLRRRAAGAGRRILGNTLSAIGSDALFNGTDVGTSALNAGVRASSWAFSSVGLPDPNADLLSAQDAALRRTAGVLVPLARAGVNVGDQARNNLYRFFGAEEIRGVRELRELKRVSSENLAQFTSLNPLATGIFGQTLQGVFRAAGVGR